MNRRDEMGACTHCTICGRPKVDPLRAHNISDAEAAPLCFADVGSKHAWIDCQNHANKRAAKVKP